MKRQTALFIILSLCFSLMSCSGGRGENDYFLEPRTLYVTLEDETHSISGVLATKKGSITFSPDEPRGLVISIDENGGSVSYGSLKFEGDNAMLTRIYPLFCDLWDDSTKISFEKGAKHPSVVEGDGFKLIIHKEESEK